MTDYQIAELLLCLRDEDGIRIEERTESAMTFREVCYTVWRARGIPEENLAEKFEKTYGGRRPDV